MLQSQQLILHEQQQTLKKKNCPVLKRKLSSCLHFKYAFKGKAVLYTFPDRFFFWTTVPVIIKRKEAQLYFSIIRCFEQFHNVIIFMWNDLC